MHRKNGVKLPSTSAILIAVVATLLHSGEVLAEDTAPPAAPQGLLPLPDYSGDIWSRTALTGDWWGTRNDLAKKGIQLSLDWTQTMQSVVEGGRDETTRYGGHGDYLLHLDLMRMGVMPGALITIRGESRYGNSANGIAGPVLPVNTSNFFPLRDGLDEGTDFALTDLNYTQFLGETFAVVLGKLDTLDGDLNEFASGRGKTQFLHGNFLFNSVLALRLPYSTLGAGVLWLPTKNITVKSLVFNTADSSTTSGFQDFGKGISWTTEADFQYRLGDLPGGFNIGGLYAFDQDFTRVGGQLIFPPGQGLTRSSKSSTWAAYGSTWQYLYVADPNDHPVDLTNGIPDHRGIGLFGRLGFADRDTNPVEWSGSFGIGGRGMIPTRDNDMFGIAYYYTRFQTTRLTGLLNIGNEGQGVEAFYNLAITRAAYLTFDVQVQNTPLPHVDTGVILGLRLNIGF